MIKRDTPVMYDGTGLLAVYVGDEAFVCIDEAWGGYDVVPEHPSLAPIYTPKAVAGKVGRKRPARQQARRGARV